VKQPELFSLHYVSNNIENIRSLSLNTQYIRQVGIQAIRGEKVVFFVYFKMSKQMKREKIIAYNVLLVL